MNVLPTLDLISMHLQNWKKMQATENEKAAELQYRIGYLSGMFNTLVVKDGKKKKDYSMVWVGVGIGFSILLVITAFFVRRMVKS